MEKCYWIFQRKWTIAWKRWGMVVNREWINWRGDVRGVCPSMKRLILNTFKSIFFNFNNSEIKWEYWICTSSLFWIKWRVAMVYIGSRINFNTKVFESSQNNNYHVFEKNINFCSWLKLKMGWTLSFSRFPSSSYFSTLSQLNSNREKCRMWDLHKW